MWTQEYLRYRVNACGHVAATQKVLDQIDGRGIAATCSGDMSGVWVGEITNYVSNPFVMDLVQTSTTVVGSYTDRTSSGFFTGALIGERFTGRVNLGDTALLFEGKLYGADVVNGDLIGGGGIGRRSFEMRRQR